MALNLTGYQDPGSYQAEVIVPGSASANSLPLALGLIGTGSAVKRVVNEAAIRGKITAEAAPFAGAPAVNTLSTRAVRRASTTTVYSNGIPLSFTTDWQFNPASVLSSAAATVDLTTKNVLTISLDGRAPIVMYFTAVAATPAAAKAGTTNGVVVPKGATPAATTMAELAASINAALVFMTDAQVGTPGMGYGAAYGTVATVPAGKLQIASPASIVASDVAVFSTFPASADMLTGTLAFTGSTVTALDGAQHAKTVMQLVAFNAANTYTVDYVSLDNVTDALSKANATTPLSKIKRIGNFAGSTAYILAQDYAASGNNISWSSGIYTSGKVLSVAVGTGFNLATNETVSFSVDGKAAIDVHLAVNPSAPPGWVAPAVVATATAAEVANNINATLAASVVYGPLYAGVATVVGSGTAAQVQVQTPTAGTAGVMEVAPSAASYAGATVFGLAATQLPADFRGVGARPTVGQTFYATYEYTRPISDYSLPKQYFTSDTAFADIGVIAAGNPLAIAVSLAFKNGAPSVYVVQVDDHLTPGAATQIAVDAALTATQPITGITELVVLDTRSALMVDLFNSVTAFNGPSQQHFCRGWYGMAKGTQTGDRDTVGTFVYTATKTLQTPADSPSRGRHILVAPAQGDVQLALEDGSTVTVTLDGNYIAAALAARYTARTSVAQSLINQTLVGFTNVSDDPTVNTFPMYQKAERALLADSGVCVVTNRGGKLTLLDPLTTERGGGRLAEFEEPQASCCKDDVVTAINQSVNGNLAGVVPSDLADFILTVKQTIGNVLKAKIAAGSIGPFRDSSGRARDLSFTTDLQVFQSKSDARQYTFKYFFNLRYPAKYFFGEYSVDNPFFTGASTGLTA